MANSVGVSDWESTLREWKWAWSRHWNAGTHTARKPWDCDGCDDPFMVGDEYYGSTGGFNSTRFCGPCVPKHFKGGGYGSYDDAIAAGLEPSLSPGCSQMSEPAFNRETRVALRRFRRGLRWIDEGDLFRHFVAANLKICVEGGVDSHVIRDNVDQPLSDREFEDLLEAAAVMSDRDAEMAIFRVERVAELVR